MFLFQSKQTMEFNEKTEIDNFDLFFILETFSNISLSINQSSRLASFEDLSRNEIDEWFDVGVSRRAVRPMEVVFGRPKWQCGLDMRQVVTLVPDILSDSPYRFDGKRRPSLMWQWEQMFHYLHAATADMWTGGREFVHTLLAEGSCSLVQKVSDATNDFDRPLEVNLRKKTIETFSFWVEKRRTSEWTTRIWSNENRWDREGWWERRRVSSTSVNLTRRFDRKI